MAEGERGGRGNSDSSLGEFGGAEKRGKGMRLRSAEERDQSIAREVELEGPYGH